MVADHAAVNGIDYLEVLDAAAPAGSPPQRTLLLRCFKSVIGLSGDNVEIEGGPRNPKVDVLWALPASEATTAAPAPGEPITPEEETYFQSLSDPENVLVVRTDSAGDFSAYTLRLVDSPTNPLPPADYDLQLSEVNFSFKVECPSDFDCGPEDDCPPDPPSPDPPIDYLAKDYASFRRLMLDRLSVIAPEWQERNPADLGIALVEGLAYAADHLSYFQDAVATEAYLGTARKRVSVRRHARLLDYAMHEGCNARVWVALEVDPLADGKTLPGLSSEPGAERPGTLMLTRTAQQSVLLDESDVDAAIDLGAQSFETLHSLVLRQAHNKILFYTWGDDRCCLPRGATEASLTDEAEALQLEVGDVLILEELRGPESGLSADADPTHDHAVRLTKVEKTEDPLSDPPVKVVDIAWDPEDALPFPLCLWEVDDQPVSVARGNVVLADHGRTLTSPEALPEVPSTGIYRPDLQAGPLTHQGQVLRVRQRKTETVVFDPDAAASRALRWDVRAAQPAIALLEPANPGARWTPHRDLLGADRFTRAFVVEVEDDQRAFLRFGGDDLPGRRPETGVALDGIYRVGNGSPGNVGAETIAHVVSAPTVDLSGVTRVWNPMPAQGGIEAETLEQVKMYAPQAFRVQERAVTEEDYAKVTERHLGVQKAAATLRWTGSWHTMFVTVDRVGGLPVDAEFEGEIRDHLNRFRMAGYDLEIDGPRYVALEIALVICVEPGYFRSDVKEALLETLSSADLSPRRRGFFHPDNFTFGQPVYLSRVLEVVMEVSGVAWIDLEDERTRFGRLGHISRDALEAAVIRLGRLQIARLDNDRNAPENGMIKFLMVGGL